LRRSRLNTPCNPSSSLRHSSHSVFKTFETTCTFRRLLGPLQDNDYIVIIHADTIRVAYMSINSVLLHQSQRATLFCSLCSHTQMHRLSVPVSNDNHDATTSRHNVIQHLSWVPGHPGRPLARSRHSKPSWHFYYIDSSQLSRVIITTRRSIRSGIRTRGQARLPNSYRQARNMCDTETGTACRSRLRSV
jgi:hypothetical protein